MVEEDSVHRYRGHFWSVCTVFWCSFFFVFVHPHPPTHTCASQTACVSINGLIWSTYPHPHVLIISTWGEMLKYCHKCYQNECNVLVVFFNLGTLLATSWGKKKKNVDVDELYLLSAQIPCRVFEYIVTSWQAHNVRFSISSNLIIGSVSCITWPFHL